MRSKLAAISSPEPGRGLGWNFPELADLLEHEPLREAAVLIGLVRRESGWHVLLTQRNEQLNHHGGQVSFPGGRLDPGETAIDAALRECFEEVGISRTQIEVVGYQQRFATISSYVISPVLAILDSDLNPVPQQSEVAEIFEAPLSLFFDRTQHQPETRMWKGRVRSTTIIPFQKFRIWGATASMMLKLVELLEAAEA